MVLAATLARLNYCSSYLLMLICLLATTSLTGQNGPFADVLLTNGQIYTMAAARKKVQALANKGEQIIFAGSDQAAQAFIGPQTKLVKLEDRMVLNQDLFAIPKTNIHQTKVLLPFYEGELVYENQEWKTLLKH